MTAHRDTGETEHGDGDPGRDDASADDAFQSARSRLTGRAYRVLGVLADADDVVQDAWMRWSAADRTTITNPDAWLNTVVTRLAIDRLRQRKRDEERYVGPWLPSPIVQRLGDPADAAELADTMTTGFLIMLERLSPDERVAFLLADVFGERYDSIAASLGRTPESCRQLASRARRKVRDSQQVRSDGTSVAEAVVQRFLMALATGDEATAIACLAPDALYVGDGGPHQRAARVPVREPARIVRLLATLVRRTTEGYVLLPAMVGGQPGVILERNGQVLAATGLEVVGGRIVRITNVVNPDKLVAIERAGAPLV